MTTHGAVEVHLECFSVRTARIVRAPYIGPGPLRFGLLLPTTLVGARHFDFSRSVLRNRLAQMVRQVQRMRCVANETSLEN